MCIGTEYDAIINGAEKSNSIGVAIVPKGCNGPQRICIYPKKTVASGLVVIFDRDEIDDDDMKMSLIACKILAKSIEE